MNDGKCHLVSKSYFVISLYQLGSVLWKKERIKESRNKTLLHSQHPICNVAWKLLVGRINKDAQEISNFEDA